MPDFTRLARGALAVLILAFGARPAGAMPRPGQPAPDFTLPAQDGREVSLRDYRGKWVVLYFYPKDFTSGCTLQARNFQRDSARYESLNAVVLGVSVDDAATHDRFCRQEGLAFSLLADTAAAVSRRYGSAATLAGRILSMRNTFLIDPAGTVRKVYRKVSVSRHSSQVLSDLRALQGHEAP